MHIFRKQFGQNFLRDANVLRCIVKEAHLGENDVVLEIGSGDGSLTEVLATHCSRVLSFEIDRTLIPLLKTKFSKYPHVDIIEADVLNVELEGYIKTMLKGKNSSWKFVANLPYNIGTSIVKRMLTVSCPPTISLVMLQKEVAQAMTSNPPAMESLGVYVQFFTKPRIVKVVSSGCFYPSPKVTSALLLMEHTEPPLPRKEWDSFFTLVRSGFAYKRKTLASNLRRFLKDLDNHAIIEIAIEKTGHRRDVRAEYMSVDEWLKLYEVVKREKEMLYSNLCGVH